MSCCKDNIPEFFFTLNEGLDDSFLPSRSDLESTGWDVKAAIEITIDPFSYFKIPLGFRAFPPEGWWFQLHPRSSSFTKKSMHILVGIIDETYPQEVILAGQYLPNHGNDSSIIISKGERIGQIIPVKRQEMLVSKVSAEDFNALCERRAAVRSGGFGSTG
jgi:dUTP pyrophosphatase